MSQSAARVSRRDLRRAFGTEAVALVEQQSASLGKLAEGCVALAGRVQDLEGVRDRGFWGRLRWLVRGT